MRRASSGGMMYLGGSLEEDCLIRQYLSKVRSRTWIGSRSRNIEMLIRKQIPIRKIHTLVGVVFQDGEVNPEINDFILLFIDTVLDGFLE